MTMKNGAKINRKWLVYSVSADADYCFGCQLFGRSNTSLSSNGFRSWKNISDHLRSCVRSKEHSENLQKWLHLVEGLKKNATIDSVNQQLMNNEIIHWRMVLRRLFAIVCHLAERNLAFRGHSEHLYEPRNGNFLGQVELMAQFDAVMIEHVRRFKSQEARDHYLSKRVQNEIISVIAQKILDAIVALIKRAKYFSVIMDCTPDCNHTEQLSIVLRIANCEEDVGLFETFIEHLKKLQLNISDCRRQSYDNGSNMQGKHQGVQRRVLDINKKAMYVPCGSHSLNLVICDAAQSSVQSVTSFGQLQRLYNLFSSSVQRWEIMQAHVKKMTVKSLSTTRWECRIDSVKAIRYQMPEMVKALEALVEHAMVKKPMLSLCQSVMDS
ncbi:Zinc finger MYM-type protein 1 [Merluccius polli]|uniref:Zinc finger MYM-type protein 1 n=1 Tax=Merluccius polli TaxID=89951 RepID=A0AA47N1L8_MERPO|nr:Zinc finger MYM-type protein 1 [Merluccius polli]